MDATILASLLTWLRENAWAASWTQLTVTFIVAAVDLYVVLWVLFRQILGPTPKEDRHYLGRALSNFADGEKSAEPRTETEAIALMERRCQKAYRELEFWREAHL